MNAHFEPVTPEAQISRNYFPHLRRPAPRTSEACAGSLASDSLNAAVHETALHDRHASNPGRHEATTTAHVKLAGADSAADTELLRALDTDDAAKLLSHIQPVLLAHPDEKGRTFVHRSVEPDKPNLLAALPLLLKKSPWASWIDEDRYGDMAVERAARLGNVAAVRIFLQQAEVTEKLANFARHAKLAAAANVNTDVRGIALHQKMLLRINALEQRQIRNARGRPLTYSAERALHGNILHTAIESGHPATVAAVLKGIGQIVIKAPNCDLRTPLEAFSERLHRVTARHRNAPELFMTAIEEISLPNQTKILHALWEAQPQAAMSRPELERLYSYAHKLLETNTEAYSAALRWRARPDFYALAQRFESFLQAYLGQLDTKNDALGDEKIAAQASKAPHRFSNCTTPLVHSVYLLEYKLGQLLNAGSAKIELLTTKAKVAEIDHALNLVGALLRDPLAPRLQPASVHQIFSLHAQLHEEIRFYAKRAGARTGELAQPLQIMRGWSERLLTSGLQHHGGSNPGERRATLIYDLERRITFGDIMPTAISDLMLKNVDERKFHGALQLMNQTHCLDGSYPPTIAHYVALDERREAAGQSLEYAVALLNQEILKTLTTGTDSAPLAGSSCLQNALERTIAQCVALEKELSAAVDGWLPTSLSAVYQTLKTCLSPADSKA